MPGEGAKRYDTGMETQIVLQDRIRKAIDRSKETDKLCAVLALKVDEFSEIAAGLGDDRTDEILSAMADRLARHLDDAHAVCHLRGGDFVLVVPELSSNHDAYASAHNILEIFRQPFWLGDVQGAATASLGIAIHPFTTSEPHAMLEGALEAASMAQARGGNDFEVARPQIPARDVNKVHDICARKDLAARFGENPECVISSAAKRRFVPVMNGRPSA